MSAIPSITELKSVPMLVVAACFLSLSWFVVLLRVYVRAFMIRSFGWDDWLMIVTQILYTLNCGLVIAIAVIEMTADLTTAAPVERIVVYLVITFGLYILAMVVFKISLAIFFLRVVNERWQRQVIWATVTIYTIVGVIWLFIAIFECGSPLHFAERETLGKCLSWKEVLEPFNYFHGALNAVSDWIFAIIPIFVVRGAQMTREARFSVIAILALGAAGSVTSLVRLAYVGVLGVGVDKIFVKLPEYGIVSMIEIGFGVIAASLATLRPLFSRFIDKATTAVSSSRGKRSKKMTNTAHSDHGIVMSRSVNVGFERHELDSLPQKKMNEQLVDSGIGSITSPTGKDFFVSVNSTSPRASDMMSNISGGSDLHHHKSESRSHSQSSDERALIYMDKC